jgi:CheY-like chemotaxis protein
MDIIYKHRILVVAHYEEQRSVFSLILNKQGYETFTAYSAEEALEVLSKHHIDLVITDYIELLGDSSSMDGIELTKIIKKNYDLDVLIMTGLGPDTITYEDALSVGASGLLYKSFSASYLLDSINKLLGRRYVR